MMDTIEQSRLLALLAWWRTAGVGDALDEIAIDWTVRRDVPPGADFAWPEPLSRSAAPPASTPGGGGQGGRPSLSKIDTLARPAPIAPKPPPPAQSASTGAPQQDRLQTARRETSAAASAREAARSATTLDELEALLQAFEGCPLKTTAKNMCFYRGSPAARLMIIGEAPGRDEDLAGKPFVGRAGQLLDRMLAAIDLAEADVHITNVVYWRPPGNRTPTPEEAQACKPFLGRQLELVSPEFILTLGGPAAKAILDAQDGIMRLRGRWREIQSAGRTIRVMPTLHPAYVLRQPDAKRQVWRDLLALKAELNGSKEG